MKQIHAICIAVATALMPAAVAAQPRDPDATMRRVQNALGVLNQELAATYDQIKTLQATIEANRRGVSDIQNRGPVVTMEEVEAARRKADQREAELQSQIDLAFNRIKEIEQQKQPLLRRLQEQLQVDERPEQ